MNENHRRLWCASVAKLVYPLDPARCGAALVSYLPLFTDLPDEAFSPHSAEAVALGERRMAFPSYDEVAKPLRAWWRENRPAQNRYPAISAPDPEPRRPPTPDEIAYVEARVAEAKAICAANRRPESQRAVKSAYLTPDQLRAAHKAQGTTMPPWLVESA